MSERERLKPRIRKLLDGYAISTGQHWACDNKLFIARGVTPQEAYQKLSEHMEFLAEHRRAAFGLNQLRARI